MASIITPRCASPLMDFSCSNDCAVKTPLDSGRLKYPKAYGRAGLIPMQRHNPNSIASLRFAIARTLLQCPCRGKAWPRPT